MLDKNVQRKGIGNRLMDIAERIAKQYADTVCLGVGLCDAYGSAQRMYVKRGFIPDGRGVWYHLNCFSAAVSQNAPCAYRFFGGGTTFWGK